MRLERHPGTVRHAAGAHDHGLGQAARGRAASTLSRARGIASIAGDHICTATVSERYRPRADHSASPPGRSRDVWGRGRDTPPSPALSHAAIQMTWSKDEHSLGENVDSRLSQRYGIRCNHECRKSGIPEGPRWESRSFRPPTLRGCAISLILRKATAASAQACAWADGLSRLHRFSFRSSRHYSWIGYSRQS